MLYPSLIEPRTTPISSLDFSLGESAMRFGILENIMSKIEKLSEWYIICSYLLSGKAGTS